MVRYTPRVVLFLAVLSLLLAPATSFAWNNTGHKVVGLVAWSDLTPAARATLTDILKSHPRYKEDLLADLPAGVTGEDQDRYAFAMAATWPDMVRSFSNPMHVEYNHPEWHYIDIPYCIGGQAANLPPATGPGPHNLLEALTACTAEMKNASAPAKDKAIAVCWILHLCGDVHQPLHAVEMFSPQYPKGDQGGNAIVILRTPPYPDSRTKLHTLWDSLVGQFENTDSCRDLAAGLRSDPRYSREALKDSVAVTDPAAWAQESHDLAIKYAYLNGDLKGAASGPDNAVPDQIPGLPPGYLRQAEEVAMQRVVLAGYRTADLLNGLAESK